MQLHLTLSKPAFTLPINYRPLLHGAIYRALRADADFSAALHDGPGLAGTERAFKGFTFSPLTGAYTRDGYTLQFHQQAGLEIRSWDQDMIRLLHRSLAERGRVSLGGEDLALTRCEIADRRLTTARAAIRMLSPAVAYITEEGGHTVFFQPDEERFYLALIRNAERKSRRFLPDVPFRLSIASLNDGLPRKQFSRFKATYITGWFGRYLLEGAPEVIDMLYQAGIGAKNSEGFGMFAVENAP